MSARKDQKGDTRKRVGARKSKRSGANSAKPTTKRRKAVKQAAKVVAVAQAAELASRMREDGAISAGLASDTPAMPDEVRDDPRAKGNQKSLRREMNRALQEQAGSW